MHGDVLYFSHARTAMKYGLKSLGIDEGDQILIPDFICEVVLHPLDDLKLKYHFYPLHDDLTAKWNELDKLVTPKTKAILMVHYFGQPQDIEAFKMFCKKHGLYLIEDNAHGYGGTLNRQPLGSFGDIGFSSPRKQLLSVSGGILYLQGVIEKPPEDLPKFPVYKLKELFLGFLRKYPYLKAYLRRIIKKEPKFSDPYSFPEIKVGDYCIDKVSQNKIEREDWNKHAEYRREVWIQLSEFAINNGLTPLWHNPHPESSPWAFPVYASNKEQRVKWLHKGWIKGIDVFPWPTLPEEVIKSSSSAMNRWKNLLCFPLHQIQSKNI